jgi:hypothetical protein
MSAAAVAVAVAVVVVLCGASPTGAAGQAGQRGHARETGQAGQAGGMTPRAPDVALVVAGGSGRTTALRSGEPGFARLRQLLQPAYTGTEPVPDDWTEGRYPAVRLTVVWGLTGVGGWPQTNRPPGGDVAVERQDQLIVADGTPWVRSDPAPDVEDDDIRWHRAPRAVYDRLDRSGLLGVGPGGSGSDAGGSGVPVWWAAGGLAAGVGGTLLIRRAAARREAGPPREEPRQELIDI